MKSRPKSSLVRVAELAALAIGAVGCEYLMFRVGRRNPSVLLMAIFAAWVSAPFAALAWCHVAAKRWSEMLRRVLTFISLLVTMGSLVAYGYVAFGPSRSQPAFFFLVLPFGSLVLIAVLIAVSARKRENA